MDGICEAGEEAEAAVLVQLEAGRARAQLLPPALRQEQAPYSTDISVVRKLRPLSSYSWRQAKHSHSCCRHPSGRNRLPAQQTYQSCGPGSVGSICFWASRLRLRILLSSRKNSKKSLDEFLLFYDFFVTFYL
jgi:hypothetical protein